MNDYFISFDMEGTPYIEHKKQAKYVAKIKNGPKTRYFYTNEEYMAYMENKRGKDKNERPPKPPKPPKKAKGSGMRKPPKPPKPPKQFKRKGKANAVNIGESSSRKANGETAEAKLSSIGSLRISQLFPRKRRSKKI